MVLSKLRELLLPLLRKELHSRDVADVEYAIQMVEIGGKTDYTVDLSNGRKFYVRYTGGMYLSDPECNAWISGFTRDFALQGADEEWAQKIQELLAKAVAEHYTWFTLPTRQGLLLIGDGVVLGRV